jgi:peptidoglycan/LPS O-acetylase OafA/YrhL
MADNIDIKLSVKDFEILDSIRGLASLYVVIAHCRGILWVGGKVFLNENPINNWGVLDAFKFGFSMLTRLAVEFVIIFFVLSGFSIAYSLSRKQKKNMFYLKRLIRIYPPYIVALIWAGIVFLVTREMNPHFYENIYEGLVYERYVQMLDFLNIEVIFKNLVYMPSEGFITPFWSLSHEVIFYLIAPYLFLKRNIYCIVSSGLFIIQFFCPNLIDSLIINPILKDFIFLYNFFFMLGAVLFWNFGKVLKMIERVSKFKIFGLMFIFILMTYGLNFYHKTSSTSSYLSASFFAIILIVYFLKYSVNISFLKKIGIYSYTLYITHVATIFLLHSLYFKIFNSDSHEIRNFLVFIPAIFICLLVAFLQYYFIERKTKVLLNRIRSNKK